jgi:hypothetical protein
MRTFIIPSLVACAAFMAIAPKLLSQQHTNVTTRHVETVVFENSDMGVYRSNDAGRTWSVVRQGSGQAALMAQRWPVAQNVIEFDDGSGHVVRTSDPLLINWQTSTSRSELNELVGSDSGNVDPSKTRIRYLSGQLQALEVLIGQPGFYVVEVVSATTGHRRELHRGHLAAGSVIFGQESLQNLQTGVYICRVSNDAESISMSFVVQE